MNQQDQYSPNKDDQQQGPINNPSMGDPYIKQESDLEHEHEHEHEIENEHEHESQGHQYQHLQHLHQPQPQLHQPQAQTNQPDYLMSLLLINQSFYPYQLLQPPNQQLQNRPMQLLHQQRQIQNYNQQMQLQFAQIQQQQGISQLHLQQHLSQQYVPQLQSSQPHLSPHFSHHLQLQQAPQQAQRQAPQVFQPSFPYQQMPVSQQHAPVDSSLPSFMPFIPTKKFNSSPKRNIPSRVRTPDNPSVHIPQPPGSSSRKRHRRSESMNVEDLDFELKQLAFKASEIPLNDLAVKIKAVENDDRIPESSTNIIQESVGTPGSSLDIGIGNKSTSKERQRQIFAMVWLLGSCESSATAVVPRNRIYARYVQICADNNLKPLSPASFGKLVRILFPNLTTRRLGMRGQSKYHYCGIKLVGDNSFQNLSSQSPDSSASSPFATNTGGGVGGGFDSPHSIDRASTPTNFIGGGSPITIGTQSYSNLSTPAAAAVSTSASSLDYLQFGLHYQYLQNSLKYIPNLFDLVDKSLNIDNMHKSPIKLPSIYPYLPRDSDYDIADTLYSLYRVHCTTIFESLRYMQLKQLFAAFSNFTVILTTPVSKLYVSGSTFEWVKLCDSTMYRAMTKMLTKLHLQNVPDDVLHNLRVISSQYIEKLSLSLQNKVPKNFYVMKLVGAQKFVNLLKRLIQVIETGQSATRILNNPVERQSMLDDWMRLNINEIVLREVPCSNENLQALLSIFGNDFIPLFKPNENPTPLNSQHSLNNPLPIQDSGDIDFHSMSTNAAATLAPIANFLSVLPSKFSRVNARLFILVTSNLLTTCLREISLSGGQGFGAWWVVRCWVDEYLTWYFELGGFLQEEFLNEFGTLGELQSYQAPQSQNQEGLAASAIPRDITTSMDVHQENPKSIFDLLDDSYGFETNKVEDPAEIILDYDNVGVNKLLGKSENTQEQQHKHP